MVVDVHDLVSISNYIFLGEGELWDNEGGMLDEVWIDAAWDFYQGKLTYLWHQLDHIIKCHIWHHRNEMNEGIHILRSKILKEFYCYFESYYFSLDANEYGNMSSLKTNIERSLTNPEKLAKTSTLPYRRIYSFPWTSYSGTDSLHDSERTSELICARFVF